MFPDLESLLSSFHVLPHASMRCLEVAFPTVPQAALVAAYASKTGRYTNIQSTLQQQWAKKNRVIMEPATVSSAPEVPAFKRKACLTDGFCSCTHLGKVIKRTKNACKNILQRVAPRTDKEQRQLLLNGGYVLEIAPDSPSLSPDTAWGAAALEVLEDEQTSPGNRSTVWLHIAMQYLKPWRSTYQVLDYVETNAFGRVLLQQTNKYFPDHRFFATLCYDIAWNVQIYEIVSTSQPLAFLNPSHCWVQRCCLDTQPLYRVKVLKARRARPTRTKPFQWHDPEGDLAHTPPHTTASSSAGPSAREEPDNGSGDEAAVSQSDVGDSDDLQEDDVDNENVDVDDLLQQLLGYMEEELAPTEADLPIEDPPAVMESAEPEPGSVPQAAEGQEEEYLAGLATVPEDAPMEPTFQEATIPAESVALPPPMIEVQQAIQPSSAAGVFLAPRTQAEDVLHLEYGKLTYYSQGYFTATCQNPAHGRCVLTRSALEGRQPSQGRPLAFLTCWLRTGLLLDSKSKHWDKANWPSLQQRQTQRDLIQNAPGFESLLMLERCQRAGEGPEPDKCP
eukprot:6475368-Amphidinium_carterae.2